MIDGILAHACLTVSPVVVISPVLEQRVGTDILSSCQNPHPGSLTYGLRAMVVAKAKWKPQELFLPRKISNPKQYSFPGRTAKISAIIQDLKDAR